MDRIICVVGPTASGKTKLAVQLAKLYDGEVVSCDSMQIYKHMDIGTAKPTKEEMEGIAHHLIDMVEPGEDFSAGKYVQLADACVQDILSRGKTAVIAGGTGLYVDSLIAGRSFAPVPQTGRREALEAQPGEQTISVSQSKSAYEGLFIYTGTFEDLTPDKDTPVYAVLGGVCYEACPTEAGFQLLTPAGSGLSLLVCMDGVYQCLQATIE